jgi:hypothetical protein
MQSSIEFLVLSNMVTILVSASVGIYLLRVWLHQSSRLITDLPLVFAITTISQALQTILLLAQNIGLVEPSMELFRLRSIIIGGSIIPLIGALLQIWAPRIQKHHIKILAIATLYWISIALLGYSEATIMTLTIPLIVIAGIMMMVTFFITWRTGRLREIRSEIMILAIPFAMTGQILRVPLLTTSLFYIPNMLLALSLAITAFAFTNPWSKKYNTSEAISESPRALEVSAEF